MRKQGLSHYCRSVHSTIPLLSWSKMPKFNLDDPSQQPIQPLGTVSLVAQRLRRRPPPGERRGRARDFSKGHKSEASSDRHRREDILERAVEAKFQELIPQLRSLIETHGLDKHSWIRVGEDASRALCFCPDSLEYAGAMPDLRFAIVPSVATQEVAFLITEESESACKAWTRNEQVWLRKVDWALSLVALYDRLKEILRDEFAMLSHSYENSPVRPDYSCSFERDGVSVRVGLSFGSLRLGLKHASWRNGVEHVCAKQSVGGERSYKVDGWHWQFPFLATPGPRVQRIPPVVLGEPRPANGDEWLAVIRAVLTDMLTENFEDFIGPQLVLESRVVDE